MSLPVIHYISLSAKSRKGYSTFRIQDIRRLLLALLLRWRLGIYRKSVNTILHFVIKQSVYHLMPNRKEEKRNERGEERRRDTRWGPEKKTSPISKIYAKSRILYSAFSTDLKNENAVGHREIISPTFVPTSNHRSIRRLPAHWSVTPRPRSPPCLSTIESIGVLCRRVISYRVAHTHTHTHTSQRTVILFNRRRDVRAGSSKTLLTGVSCMLVRLVLYH